MEKKMKATKTKLNIQFKLIDSGTPTCHCLALQILWIGSSNFSILHATHEALQKNCLIHYLIFFSQQPLEVIIASFSTEQGKKQRRWPDLGTHFFV